MLDPSEEWLFPAPKSATGHTVAIEKAFRRVVAAELDPEENCPAYTSPYRHYSSGASWS